MKEYLVSNIAAMFPDLRRDTSIIAKGIRFRKAAHSGFPDTVWISRPKGGEILQRYSDKRWYLYGKNKWLELEE